MGTNNHLGSTALCAPERCDDPECQCNREANEAGARAQRAAEDGIREDRANEAHDAATVAPNIELTHDVVWGWGWRTLGYLRVRTPRKWSAGYASAEAARMSAEAAHSGRRLIWRETAW